MASGSVQHDAYLMCNGVVNALPNTHSTLTATIANGPSGSAGSIILSSMPTAPSSDTLPTATPAVTITSLPTPTASGAGSTASGTPAPEAAALNTAQIVGIVAGVVGTILITLVAISIARCIRKRRYPDLEDGLSPMDDNRSKSTAAGSKKAGALMISPPFRRFSKHKPDPRPQQLYRTPPPRFPMLTPPLNPRTPPNPGSSPSPFRSPNSNQEVIGLAISRSLNSTPSKSPEIPTQRPQSRLLPAKPALSIKIPPQRPPRPQAPLPQPQTQTQARSQPAANRVLSSQTPHTDRTSVLTNMTAFADLDTEAAEGQVWRPPPSNPQSATTLYVADKWGNWVLNNNNRQPDMVQVAEPAELDTYTPLTKSPIEKREEEAVAMAAAISASSAIPKRPPPAFLSTDHIDQGPKRSSSVYSQASAVRRNSRPLTGRSSGSRRGNGAQITRSDTIMSHGSATTINTSSSSPFDEEVPFELDNSRLSQLSTVMETPSPTTGRSPVKYPKIPGRLNRAMLETEPPPRPDFTASPPGQPSPTLKGAAVPVNETGSPYPPPLHPKRAQGPRVPGFRRNLDAEDDLPRLPRLDETRPQMQSPMSRFAPRVPGGEASAANFRRPERLQTPPMQTSGSGFSPHAPSAEAFPTPSPLSSRSGTGGDARPHHVARAISPLSAATMSSGAGASALLAKRVGTDKAAALALDPNGKKARWRRGNHGNNGGAMLSPDDAGLASPRGTLPQTPVWQPKLTPTRHGEDLYLNVQ